MIEQSGNGRNDAVATGPGEVSRDMDAERRVLEHRARELARPSSTSTRGAIGDETLVFLRGRERFGIPLDAVVEVRRGPPLTPLASATAPVVGVIAWRGRILTVIDIGEAADRTTRDDWRAVIVGRSRACIAIVADAVDETRTVVPDEWRPIDELGSASRLARAPIRGVTSDALIILDGEQLLRQYAG